jgi:hypothetical protein
MVGIRDYTKFNILQAPITLYARALSISLASLTQMLA